MEATDPESSTVAELRWMNPKVEWVASTRRRECADVTVASCVRSHFLYSGLSVSIHQVLMFDGCV